MSRNMFGSAALAAFVIAPSAHAQDAPSAAAAAADDEIIVTGTLLARQRAIDVKRQDTRVVEALTSDELGQVPDKNIGESLNRLPGVSILIEKGEGRYVQIRGVAANLNHVTINGIEMGSPEVEDGGRQAPLDIISAGVLNRVEVVKTRTPDMDGQGIGGTVNVVTQMPFDRKASFYGQFSGRIGYEDLRPRKDGYGGHEPWSVDGMISGKLADDRFGWLLGGTYSRREYSAVGIYQDDWDEGTGVPLPVNVKNNYYVIGRERLNLNGAIEFRPSDENRFFVRAFYATWDEFQHRNRFEENFSVGVVPAADGLSGISGPNRAAANIRLEESEKQLFSVAGGGSGVIGLVAIDAVIQYNENSSSFPSDYWEWRSGAVFGPNSWTLGDNGIVSITPDAGTPDRQDPALFPLRRVRFFESDLGEEALITRVDATVDLVEAVALSAGLKASRTTRDNDMTITQYDPGTSRLTLGTTDFTNGGFANRTPAGTVPNILMDIDAMNVFFADPANAAFFRRNTAVQLTNDFSSDYSLTEKVYAGYGLVRYDADRFDAVGGVRVERTEVDSAGFLISGATATRISAAGSYTTWLPSIVANWRPDDQWVVRGGVTRALGRPGFNTIAPRSTFTTESAVIGRLSVGNPGLEPRTAWNYDASVEFYPDAFSAFAVAVFRKDISDDFVAAVESFSGPQAISDALAARGFAPGTIDISGLSRLDIATTVNAGSTYIQGIEFSGQTQFSMLPVPFNGLGLSGTATFLKGRTQLTDGTRAPVQGQPKQTYAASIFYQNGGLDASVNYAWNASYPTELNDDPDLNLDQGAFGRIDARISYTFPNRLRVFVEGVNLNNEPTSEFQGGRREWNTEYEYVGRTFYFGLSYGF